MAVYLEGRSGELCVYLCAFVEEEEEGRMWKGIGAKEQRTNQGHVSFIVA